MSKTFYLFPLLLSLLFSSQSYAHTTEGFFPKIGKTEIANLGPGCRVRLSVPKKARIGAHYESNDLPGRGGIGIDEYGNGNHWGMSLQCHNSTDDYVTKGWAGKNTTSTWKLIDSESTKQLLQLDALRFYPLHAVNSTGWAVTYDDTFGEEQFRQRTLAYCLIKGERALCGESKVGLLEKIDKNERMDFTRKVLEMLKRFEFLIDSPPTAPVRLPKINFN